jgi:hypothetical protein
MLRRVVLPMREVVNTLMRRDLHVVDEALHPYFQDVYDHVLRATEWTESLRDLVTTILETNLTIQGNRMNESSPPPRSMWSSGGTTGCDRLARRFGAQATRRQPSSPAFQRATAVCMLTTFTCRSRQPG